MPLGQLAITQIGSPVEAVLVGLAAMLAIAALVLVGLGIRAIWRVRRRL